MINSNEVGLFDLMPMTRNEAQTRLGVDDLGLVVEGNSVPQSVGLTDPYANPVFGLVTIARWPRVDESRRAFVRRWIIPKTRRDEPWLTNLKPHVATRSILSLPEINDIAAVNGFPPVRVLPEVVLNPEVYAPMAKHAAAVIVQRFAEEPRLPGNNLIVI